MSDLGILAFLMASLLYSMPYIMGAMSGIFSERSGIANIGIEGLMIAGAFATSAGIVLLSNWFSPEIVIYVALPLIVGCGILFSFILSITTIRFRADQIIAGITLNAIAFALLLTLTTAIAGQQRISFNDITVFQNVTYFTLAGVEFNTYYILTILCILLLLVGNFVLFKTPFGLRLRAAGENPSAAESMGINVNRIRYQAVAIAGVYGALAGMFLSLSGSGFFSGTVAGQGFLAIAILILARWKPILALGIGYAFGALNYVAVINGGNLEAFGTAGTYLMLMVPYVLTIVILLVTYKLKSGAPAAVGENYISE